MSSDEPSLTGTAPGSVPQPSCPAFLSKLWLLVGDESTDDLIHWSDEGNSFIVQDQVIFAQILLPQFFKHNNMASFIRQLNMYGFRKKAHLDDGALKTERTDIEFQHPHFLRGEIKQLELIKRKVSGKDDSKVKTNEVGKILSEVRDMKGKQSDITNKLESMKVENTALWREVVSLRQKHEKQQKIVNRLIHFLISLVQPKPKVGATRKRPMNQLMIEGLPDTTAPSKAKFSRTLPGAPALDGLQVRGIKQQESNLDFLSRADSPTLTDIIDNAPSRSKVTELLEQGVEADGLIPSNIPPAAVSSIPIAQDPVNTNQDQQAGISELLGQSYLLDLASYESPTVPVTTTASAAIASDESVGSQALPSASIPVQTALSPNVTYPLTPRMEDPEWLDLEDDTPADVVLETAGVEGLGMSTGEDGGGLFGPGEGQLVLTSHSPTNENKQQSQEDNPHRVMIQRMLSNEEQKQDLGEQLNTVQSNLNDFKQLITTNPSLNLEFGELLNDFQVFFDEPGPLTIPDAPTNYDNVQTEENGKNEGASSTDVIPTGNELVTYKPSTSYSSLASFMADDEDSLLQSLDDDSLALRQQKENDGINFLL